MPGEPVREERPRRIKESDRWCEHCQAFVRFSLVEWDDRHDRVYGGCGRLTQRRAPWETEK